MPLTLRATCAAALLAVSGWAAAQTVTTPVAPPVEAGGADGATPTAADCARVDDPARRLACYDRAHGRAAPPQPAAAPVAVPPPVLADPGNPVPMPTAPTEPDPCSRLPEAVGSARNYLGSTLSERWELSCRDQLPAFLPRPYKPVYLLPVSWSSRVNRTPIGAADPDNGVVEALDLDKNEAKFQVSLKSKIWSSDEHGTWSVWGAYTQSSRWQVYNGRISRPFRETNYEPELILTRALDVDLPFGWKARMAGLAFNHQSNGRAQPLSRSWNRLIGDLSLERGETTVSLRPWWRVQEGSSDDNPGIQRYMGRGELLVTQKWRNHVFALQARHSLRSGKDSRGSAQFEWAFPLGAGLHGYAQLFSGYGESLIDYNFKETRFGLGVSVVEWR